MADDQKPKTIIERTEDALVAANAAAIGPRTAEETRAYFDAFNKGDVGEAAKKFFTAQVAIAEDVGEAIATPFKKLSANEDRLIEEAGGAIAAAYKNVTNPDRPLGTPPGAKPVAKDLHHGQQ